MIKKYFTDKKSIVIPLLILKIITHHLRLLTNQPIQLNLTILSNFNYKIIDLFISTYISLNF